MRKLKKNKDISKKSSEDDLSTESEHNNSTESSDSISSYSEDKNYSTKEDSRKIQENPLVIEQKLKNISQNKLKVASDVITMKKSLLQLYLINLLIYKRLEPEEKKFSPIKEKLIKLSILIEKVTSIENKSKKYVNEIEKEKENNNVIGDDFGSKEVAPRKITKEILVNKGIMKSRSRENSNPRVKNKRKAGNLFEKGKFKKDENIDTKKTKTNKFK